MNEIVIQEIVLIHNDDCYYISIDRGVSLTMYAPRRKGGGSSRFSISIVYYMQKRGKGVQLACKNACIINGRAPYNSMGILLCLYIRLCSDTPCSIIIHHTLLCLVISNCKC